MVRERAYIDRLTATARMRVEFNGWHGWVERFVVQLELTDGQRWLPAVRDDTSHGGPHRDTIDRRGREIAKEWLPAHWTYNEAMTYAVADIRAHWPMYEDRFWGERDDRNSTAPSSDRG